MVTSVTKCVTLQQLPKHIQIIQTFDVTIHLKALDEHATIRFSTIFGAKMLFLKQILP
jgi:hypothetical protein